MAKQMIYGDEKEISKCAQDLKWDISKYKIIHEPIENNTAAIAAKLAKEKKNKNYCKRSYSYRCAYERSFKKRV